MAIKMNKKSMMGIGTLIIFISSVLVAAISASVMITTGEHLREAALTTGKKAREAYTANFFIEKIKGTDGRDGNVEVFEIIFRVAAGGEVIGLNKTSITIFMHNSSDVISYGGVSKSSYFTNRHTRMITWDITASQARLKTDLDEDLVEDYVWVHNSTMLKFNLSTDPDVNISIKNITYPGTVFNSESYDINSSTEQYATLIISGTTTTANELHGSMDIRLIPEVAGTGTFTVDPILMSLKYRDNAVHYGDVMRMYVESSSSIGEGMEISFSIVTPSGAPLTRRFVTPNIMTEYYSSIFP